uniref:Gypsy/Ty3 retroelement polyprotein n=1 Tax=Tanacetum cinerariifolium TaxID=118510 RepID=A0A699IJU9_TANCI|nr:gypsy/Ty3 retroelement polyprotein [Tanacetum cinerariifolium]
MLKSPILALPNFDEEFIIKTDASGLGIGAVLQQHGHLIACLSKILAPRHQSVSTYEIELLDVDIQGCLALHRDLLLTSIGRD